MGCSLSKFIKLATVYRIGVQAEVGSVPRYKRADAEQLVTKLHDRLLHALYRASDFGPYARAEREAIQDEPPID